MQTSTQTETPNLKFERVAAILRAAGWLGIVVQLAFAATSALMVLVAISGRTFNQAMAPESVTASTTPGIGISIFFAACGVLALLISAFLAFRQTRFAKRLSNPNPSVHPQKIEVQRVLRSGIIIGLIGMLLTILGGGAALGVLLAKSIAQPQGVAIYDPARIIRSLDVFVAMANMTGITGHFVGTIGSLGLFNWLHRQ
jgi:hypothetical protein